MGERGMVVPRSPGSLTPAAAAESAATTEAAAASEPAAAPAIEPTARTITAGSESAAAREVIQALRAVEARAAIAIELIERGPARVEPIASGRAQGAGGPDRPVHVVPAAAAVLLPRAARLAIHVAVAARIDVAAAAAPDHPGPARPTPVVDRAAAAAARHASGRAGRVPGHARRRRPLIAALHAGGSPAAVDVRSASGRCSRSSPRVERGHRGARTERTVRRGSPRICAGRGVIARAKPGAAIWTVHPGAARIGAVPRVVARAI